MDPKRRRELRLAGLVVLLGVGAFAAYQALSTGTRPAPSAGKTAASNKQARTGNRASGAGPEAPQVNLDALDADRTEPGETTRDIFRFRVKPPPPPPPPPRPTVGPQPPPPPAVPPPPPPIGLKFIGVIDMPAPGRRVAILSDGRGAPVYGHEGETVLGQYRILRIGAESVEMAYLDGRGRQTIRLSGS